MDIQIRNCHCGKSCKGFKRGDCNYTKDSKNSRLLVIDFESWEEREEFIDWFIEKGRESLKNYYNSSGKEIKFIYRGKEDHKYKENCGEVSFIRFSS